MKIGKKAKLLEASVSILLVMALIMPAVIADDSDRISVDLDGPFWLDIGEYKTFNYTIIGGVPPYSLMWHWGDGSGGTASTHAYGGNKESVFNVALAVKDSEGNSGVGSTRVYTKLPTDNNVFIEKFVKHQDSNRWQKRITAEVGDTLDIKLVIKRVGSSILNMSVADEHTVEFFCDGSFNSSIPPDDYIFYPGGEYWGPAFQWLFYHVGPNTTIEITYDVQVISEFSSPAYLEGFALDGAGVYAYVDDENGSKIGPGGFVASDDDFVLVRILEDPGEIFYVGGGSNFTRIQDAIDAASDGDTIIVRPGIYIESVYIDKSIKLIGSGSGRTIIDGLGNISFVVRIMADDVTIRGFTIRNAFKSGIYVDGENNFFTRNRIMNCGLEGIYLHSGDNNIVTYNKLISNTRGILVLSSYNLIKGNTIKFHEHWGISVDPYAVANDILENNFINNNIQAWDFNFYGNHWTGYSFSQKRFVGNFWSDYNGTDEDGDGLGDIPYTTMAPGPLPGIVLDLYPLMKPTGGHLYEISEPMEIP